MFSGASKLDSTGLALTVDVAASGAPAPSFVRGAVRPRVAGKFLFVGDDKIYVRGATYGTFRPDKVGQEFRKEIVDRDFAQMAANGLNTVRIYTTPPRWVLDMALRHGLYVMVGLSCEQYVGYLIDAREDAPDIEAAVRAKVRVCAGHPALLCYAVGNEIPAPVARWLGARRVERYLERLCRAVRDEDPDGLVTYVNYPTTEYLQLPFLDLLCFNVYLEHRDRLEAYLARLHNVAGDRPLVLSEAGLDSLRNGEDVQAHVLDWQLRTGFASGCAGVFVFAWTDEWFRGGVDAEDWAFGLTDRNRHPKPALTAVRKAFTEVPFPRDLSWPRVSVVVCSYNGERTIRECLRGLTKLEYPDFEVIVVDDGSTDATAAIAHEHGFRVISTENRGLSSARNTGWRAATGEIVAYLDDDAAPDPHWLTYLAATFRSTGHVAVGGPNIPPSGGGGIEDCVANAPGGPIHVLLSDQEAEHIPGCNMAFRRQALEAVDGFDQQFRVAGDDVDICWQLQKRGWTLGYNPAAMVWHHRRNSVRGYWKQQRGYGRAEALLEQKWPEKYNTPGHVTWAGRLYGQGLLRAFGWRRGRIYHGSWGVALFQSLYRPAPSLLGSLPLMPEWYFIILALTAMSCLAVFWEPLLAAIPLLVVALGASLLQAGLGARAAHFSRVPASRITLIKLRALTAFLFVLQPLARLSGRLAGGLSPWRLRGSGSFGLPRAHTSAVWIQESQAPDERLGSIEGSLRELRARVLRGDSFDRWDLEARDGLLGAARMLMAVEDHAGGAQFVRTRIWPRLLPWGLAAIASCAILSVAAGIERSWTACSIFAVVGAGLGFRMMQECYAATTSLVRARDRTMNGGR